jgi:hypothetical protein
MKQTGELEKPQDNLRNDHGSAEINLVREAINTGYSQRNLRQMLEVPSTTEAGNTRSTTRIDFVMDVFADDEQVA